MANIMFQSKIANNLSGIVDGAIQSLFFSITFFISFLFLFKLVTKLRITSIAPKLAPGPWPKLPLIGNMWCLAGSLPHHALRDLAKKYGPLMHLQLGEISAVVVSSPRVAKELLKTHDIAFANRPGSLASEIILYNGTDIAFSPYGDYWRQMRKICTLELLSAKKLSSGIAINLTQKIFSLSNAITCKAAFGKRCKGQDVLIELMKELALSSGGFDVSEIFPSLKPLHFLSGLRPKLMKLHQKFEQFLDTIIEKHIESLKRAPKDSSAPGEEDLLDVLFRLKERGDLEFPITIKNIKAILMDIFSAGIETSSTTLEWAMSELIRNPRVLVRAQGELREALKGKKTVHEVDIQGLSYLKSVIKETLRLHPALPLLLPRECREQCEVGGYIIPVKTKVIVNAWAMGRDSEYWHDAESFIPERFENSSIDFTGNNQEYIPFGGGRRMCPGVTFGLANVELPLAQLLYHFNWELPDGIKPEYLDMTESFGTTAGRINNLYLIAASHSSL
ncbi:hypothetical protein RJ639_021662 [Escallonia herrerae]|uniref:Cytochrome P450 n=1 Tax=Escallonia herrerae TaxID=1293975 RepID=A0AA88V2N9_9ASTE|nr:hypothetical protein RJ639_021662 [Escallonia herrerae]